jgi:hypothetical protein
MATDLQDIRDRLKHDEAILLIARDKLTAKEIQEIRDRGVLLAVVNGQGREVQRLRDGLNEIAVLGLAYDGDSWLPNDLGEMAQRLLGNVKEW